MALLLRHFPKLRNPPRDISLYRWNTRPVIAISEILRSSNNVQIGCIQLI